MSKTLLLMGTLTLLLFCFAKTTYGRVYQTSALNNKKYLVRKYPNKKHQIKSADLLAALSKKKNTLCEYLSKTKKYRNHYGVKRLLRNQYVKIEELSYEYNNEAAYSINKGERIGICLRKKNGNFENTNTMFFVLMHELAHIMSTKYAHDKEFWDNFALLIQAAQECNVYNYQNYDENPSSYCGHRISYTPK